jgi:hypothetical protein
MGKAKKSKTLTEQLSFSVTGIDKENGVFTYIDENGDEAEGSLSSIWDGIKTPFDVTIKASDKEELDVSFAEAGVE